MEDDGPALMRRKVHLVQFRHRNMEGTWNAFARMLIGFTNVDEDRTILHQTLGSCRVMVRRLMLSFLCCWSW